MEEGLNINLEKDVRINEDSFRCAPISSLEELTAFKLVTQQARPKPVGKRCFSALDEKFKDVKLKHVPKTIVCHDMKGGYADDSFIDGSNNPEAYSFIQWNLIDVFIYFSHNFITVPPPCWVHAAHLHGVHILGTIITEGDEGTATCQQIFSCKDSVDEFVSSLIKVTLHHNCDGWLINIENPIKEPLIDNIVYFLRRLKNELVSVGNPGQIIWYDSVTKDGILAWQNELNNLNKTFFDACDGIFLNYFWKPENLDTSIIVAGERALDVYVGIDVFGRNCYGGGGFNSVEALLEIRKKKLSAAIFAPGWLYECHPIEQFPELSLRFWSLLLPFLKVCGPTSLPIRTSFCQGYGRGKYVSGELVENRPWHNISHQQLQTCLAAVDGLADVEDGKGTFDIFKCGSKFTFGKQKLCLEDAFSGGACLEIKSSGSAIFPLFFCEIQAVRQMMIAVVFKRTGCIQDLRLDLGYVHQSGTFDHINVTCPLVPQMNSEDCINYTHNLYRFTVSSISNHAIFESYTGSIFRKLGDNSDWETRLFQVDIHCHTVEREDLLLRTFNLESQGQIECKLGYFCCFEPKTFH